MIGKYCERCDKLGFEKCECNTIFRLQVIAAKLAAGQETCSECGLTTWRDTEYSLRSWHEIDGKPVCSGCYNRAQLEAEALATGHTYLEVWADYHGDERIDL